MRAIEMAGKKRSTSGNYIPEIGLIVGQYNEAQTGIVVGEIWQGFTADDYGTRYGFGSEIHRQAEKYLDAVGGFSDKLYACPVALPTGSPVAASGTLTFVGAATSSGTMYFAIAGDLYEVNIASGDTAVAQAAALVALITADIGSAVTAAVGGTGSDHIVTVTAKNKGANGNMISVVQNPAGKTQEDKNPDGTAVTVPATGYLTSGAGDCIVSTVFTSGTSDNLGNTWFTLITMPYTDATSIATYKAAATARFDPAKKRPFLSFIGYTKEAYSAAYALPATINSKFIMPIWDTRPLCPAYEFSAAIAGTVAYLATLDPARPFMDTELGLLARQTRDLSYNEYDALFKVGMGYCKQIASGALITGDLASSYRTTPAGAATEEWFDAVSVTRRQAMMYDEEQLLSSAPYVRPIAGSNDLVTGKSYVIKPKTVESDLRNLVDRWAGEGWVKNPDEIKATISAEINSTYSGRIDATLTVDEAAALRIIALKHLFLY